MLLESRGIPPSIEKLAMEAINLCETYFEGLPNNHGVKLDVPWAPEGFILLGKTNLNVRAYFTVGAQNHDAYMILINPKIVGEPNFYGTLMHELTHAYQNSKESHKQNGKPLMNRVNGGYSKALQTSMESKSYDNSVNLSKLILHTQDFEVNAIIASIYGQIQDGWLDEPDSIEDAIEMFYSTPGANQIFSTQARLDNIKRLRNKSDIQKIVILTNKMCNKNFTNFSQTVKYLQNRVNVAIGKLNKMKLKIIAKYINDFNLKYEKSTY